MRNLFKKFIKTWWEALLFAYSIFLLSSKFWPSIWLFKDWICLITTIVTNYHFPRGITFSLIQFSFISKQQSPTLAFFLTQRWRWNLKLLPIKRWRNFFIKIEIWLKYCKLNSRNTTCFSFNDWIVCLLWDKLINIGRCVIHTFWSK